MAGKKFHITPNGPKRCTATFRPCPFSEHYASVESAIAADRVIQRNNAHLAELERLHDSQRNPDPRYFSRSGFMFTPNSSSPRAFGEDLDTRVAQIGIKPEIYHSSGKFRMKNGNGLDVNVQVMRMTEVDESLARYVGVWRFINNVNKSGLIRHEETKQDFVLDFSTEQKTRKSMLQAREFFRSTVVSSGIRNDDEADKRADEMAEHFKNMFNAVESDAAGDFDLWDRGMGYFTESDADTIVVNENYRTSAFRAENFKNFLKENPYYRAHQPAAEIRVTDTYEPTGASWTLKKEGGQWAVEKTFSDGHTAISNLETAQEALDHVYYHVKNEINPGDEEQALKKGRYAGALMQEVETALENNKAVINEWWRDNAAQKEAHARGNITKEMYDLGTEPKGSLMEKIFETYT